MGWLRPCYLSLYKFRKESDNFCVVFTYPIKRARGIRKFHVVVVQRQQKNVQNSVMQVQSCCLLISPEHIIFCRSPCRRRRYWFCCDPEIVLPWLRDVTLLLSVDQNMDVYYQVKHGLQASK